jgi:hypothetical protein
MTAITERRLKRLFADRGYRIHEIRHNRHYWVKIGRESGGPKFNIAVSMTPSDYHFEHALDKALRRAERAVSGSEK